MTTVLLDLLFPPQCAFCGKLLERGGVCPECEAALPFREPDRVLQTVGVKNYPCAVAMYYSRPASTGVKALKFGRKSWRAKVFARYIAQAAAEELGGQFDAVTFVPVSRWRNFTRGFDQARLLAEETAKIWGEEAVPTLRKIRNNRPQSSLTSPAARAKNVKDVYAVPRPERVMNRRFLLIDDVCTTGSTMDSAADTLTAAGAERVVCAVLAGGHRKGTVRKKPSDCRKI